MIKGVELSHPILRRDAVLTLRPAPRSWASGG
jgi:hypothetical protein